MATMRSCHQLHFKKNNIDWSRKPSKTAGVFLVEKAKLLFG